FVFMPFTGVGLYAEGDGKDLGHTVQFRNGLELGYRLGSGVQIGVSGFHMSNGGLGDENPGTEVLMLQLSVPTSGFID
ncbi:MAG TPA: acyloxyacyl hydrolase, partial [Alphaproteobacteria bacterium]|nr:acyloxyacyl hydrolase [Alphaproteobacteria bacterium]